MKKLLTVSCLLFAITFTAQQARAQVDFGIRGGVNFATLYDAETDDEAEYVTSTGVLAGIYFQLPINNSSFIIQPEILYSQKGYKLLSDDGTFVADINYIEIPVLIKFKYELDNGLAPYIEAGPYVGFLISTEVEKNDQVIAEEIKKINEIDFGLAIGAGLSYHCLSLGIRYSFGLVPVPDIEEENIDLKNHVFSIVAGVTIPPNLFE